MGETTTIAWTNATWNPVTGCTKVSPGCDNCYMFRLYPRLKAMRVPGYGESPDVVTLCPDQLYIPFRWRKPRRVFVCSMSDLFHSAVPFDSINKVMCVMAANPRHTFQILTKRPGRLAYFTNVYHPPLWEDRGATWGAQWPENVWAGTSVESAKYLPRLDVLAKVPAKVRFVSLEPLLEPIQFGRRLECRDCGCEHSGCKMWGHDFNGLNLVIVGGESGPSHRPMQAEWVQDIADQCAAAGVLLFVKQGSGQWPGQQGDLPDDLWARKEMP